MASRESDLTWDYDQEADVLYLAFGDPVPAYGQHLDEDILLRYSAENDEIVGITVIGFKEMGGVDALLKRLDALVAGVRIPLIASHAGELDETTHEPVNS